MDCSIKKTKFPDTFLVTTIDFFYPLVEDPYMQGKIGCANVLSDLYAIGIVDVDNMLMTLGASAEMPQPQREIVTREMVRGFNDLAEEAGTKVTGGQSVMNPWPIIGGVAETVERESGFIRPESAVVGDVLVLTKPLGTQVVVNAYQWMHQHGKFDRIKDVVSTDTVKRAYNVSIASMARLNRTGAKLMHKYGAHAATDVTGFGILGHADNLAKNQTAEVSFALHTLPIIQGMVGVNKVVNFKLWMAIRQRHQAASLLLCRLKVRLDIARRSRNVTEFQRGS